MELGQVFLGFLQPVALGSVAVFVLLAIVSYSSHRRPSAFGARRTSR